MREALARHDLLIESAVAGHSGTIVRPRGEGDSRFAVFEGAADAVAAACAVQRALLAEQWTTPSPLRVRIGLHTGDAQLRAGDYYGPDVNRCARIRGAAHGGQTLLSSKTAELASLGLPAGASLRSLGPHRLKDLQRPEQLFQLLHRDLQDEFPPLLTLDAYPNNLPLQLTTFIGREREITEVKRLLSKQRLVTLVGAGGCGKTRLAIQVAADLSDSFEDGVWLVELASLLESDLVPQAVAAAVGVREEPSRNLVETLVDHLRSKSVLLAIDNCEHLIEASARLVGALLASGPKIRVLATSRESLGIIGESLWRVPSLSMPDKDRVTPTAVGECEAVRLFLDRARLVVPGYTLAHDNAGALAQLCRRLDGMPLAIELAAGRLNVLSAEQIAARLDDRFRLLSGGRTAPTRQQTLRAALDWSYDLLSDPERDLFNRLSVFAGGFTLEEAEQVCAGVNFDERDVLELLSRLVNKSLVVIEEPRDAMRFLLLETVRQYGLQKLQDSEGAQAIAGKHLQCFVGFAERVEAELEGPEQGRWLDRIEADHDNMRAALAWSSANGRIEECLRLAGSLCTFWQVRGYLAEGRARLEQALMAAEEASATARAKALSGVALLARRQADYAAARSFSEESLAVFRKIGDRKGIAKVLDNLAIVAYEHEEDFERATALFEESLGLRRALADRWGMAASLNNLGVVAQWRGDYQQAAGLYEQSLTLAREVGDKRGVGSLLNNLGLMAQWQGDCKQAEALHRESLTLRQEVGDKEGIAECLEGLAQIAGTHREPERAARLYATAENVRADIGVRLVPSELATRERAVAAVREQLGAEGLDRAWREGSAMTLEEAIAYALESAPQG